MSKDVKVTPAKPGWKAEIPRDDHTFVVVTAKKDDAIHAARALEPEAPVEVEDEQARSDEPSKPDEPDADPS
ncbi:MULTISPECIES: hypothetical protein [unclassified Caballeronia]|uniref:hypothetical protein n=1 Tax=unclassified Caballeronia TaxID=2646786 RepID=UPI00285C0CB2|nr:MULTISPECIES: hypothetical protein [unclassified Caballeronia]MDR5815919.1 hypothetical protein [Caballeronia sp. LZ033]MDR5821880.1 hypothetical protein [Caballeronia sp. LZ043]